MWQICGGESVPRKERENASVSDATDSPRQTHMCFPREISGARSTAKLPSQRGATEKYMRPVNNKKFHHGYWDPSLGNLTNN